MDNTSVSLSFVDTQTVQLRLELGGVAVGQLTDVIPTTGTIDAEGKHWVNGELVGFVGGRNMDQYRPFDRLEPSPLSDLFAVSEQNGVLQAIADDPSRWQVLVNGAEVGIDVLSRKTHIQETVRLDTFSFDFTTTENVFLRLDSPIPEGATISVRMRDDDFTAIDGIYDPDDTVSEAIHVNIRGFDPDDGHKVAYLSSWNGWQVDGDLPDDGRAIAQDYAAGMAFQVVNSTTGATVLSGTTTLSGLATDGDDQNENFFGTDVFAMDFSTLGQTGTFHLVVDGVGRSNDFTIADTHWGDVFELGMSGFYHQRSGIALEQPFTDWERPRSMHPDDGLVILASTTQISETNMGYDLNRPDAFAALVAGETDLVLPDAWGGWHDAGDWDRRAQHIEVVRSMTELWEETRSFQEITTLSIPENGDRIPDILNEALWTLDFFRRLQQDDGGVRGGVESAEHPDYGDGSWGESLQVYAYAADAWTTWEYAAAAAKMSRALESYDTALARTYRDSAADAMRWAEDNVPTGDDYGLTPQNSRAVAAVEMYALTGDARWHDLYRDISAYRDGPDVNWDEHQIEAAFAYAQIDRPTDAALRQNGIDAILAEAETYATVYDQNGFGGTANIYAPYGWGTAMTHVDEAATYFARAHALTGDARWLEEMQEDAQYLLGANPQNMTYLTGLGGREPGGVLNVDGELMGTGAPPGITIYGENSVRDQGYQWYNGVMDEDVWPDFYTVPSAESYNGFSYFVPATEYTVMQGMLDTFYVTGYLAAQGMDDARRGTNGADKMNGTADDDILLGRGGMDRVRGRDGDDRLAGGAGLDRVDGGNGRDDLFGEAGNDIISGGQGDDRAFGGDGNDLVSGDAGRDMLGGSGGNDTVLGGAGRDTVFGHDGRDGLRGGSSGDWMLGGRGADRLTGQGGNDHLAGNAGADSLTGGAGADSFVFVDGDGRDVVTDFDAGTDLLLIRNADGPNAADVLAEYGTFNAGFTEYTLAFSDSDILIIRATEAFSRADIAAAIDIV